MVPGVVTIVAGIVFIVAARPLAERIIESQNKTWGFSFGPRTTAHTLWIVRVIGCLAIALGLWTAISG